MNVILTANGKGERMAKYGMPKHELLYKDRRICDYVLDTFPEAILATHHNTEWEGDKVTLPPPKSRRHTLKELVHKGYKYDVLIIDCDIVFPKLEITKGMTRTNFLYYFKSELHKYGSFLMQGDYLLFAKEKGYFENKTSGIYFIKRLDDIVRIMYEMQTDSILEAMSTMPTKCYLENNFIKLGDEQDYEKAIK